MICSGLVWCLVTSSTRKKKMYNKNTEQSEPYKRETKFRIMVDCWLLHSVAPPVVPEHVWRCSLTLIVYSPKCCPFCFHTFNTYGSTHLFSHYPLYGPRWLHWIYGLLLLYTVRERSISWHTQMVTIGFSSIQLCLGTHFTVDDANRWYRLSVHSSVHSLVILTMDFEQHKICGKHLKGWSTMQIFWTTSLTEYQMVSDSLDLLLRIPVCLWS